MLSYDRGGRAQLGRRLRGELKYSLGREIQWTDEQAGRRAFSYVRIREETGVEER